MGRRRLTVDDIQAWINESIEDLANPSEDIEYSETLHANDVSMAVLLEQARMSSLSAICLRKEIYNERYPEKAKEGFSSSVELAALMGTGFHALPHFRNKNPIYELYLEHEGVTGHIDVYFPDYSVLLDIKTTSRLPKDPRPHNVTQVAGYYAGNNLIGNKTEQVFIWYVNRCAWFKQDNHCVFELALDHRDHLDTELPAYDTSRKNRQELYLGWNIQRIWEDIQDRRKTILDGRKGILCDQMAEYDNFNHWLCKSCPFKSRCKMNVL